jgi:hypothetical protein
MDLEDDTALAVGKIFLFSNGSTLRQGTGQTLMKKLILHIIEYEKYVPHHMIIFL